jgi:hypothetical protein
MPDLTPTTIDSELTARLGQIVIRWAVAEDWLSHLLAALVDADPGGLAIVTTNVASSTVANWILTLLDVHVHKQPELQEVIDLVTRTQDLRAERNALVHGLWSPEKCEPGTCLVNTAKWDRSEIIREWLVTTAELDGLLSEINEWISDYAAVGRKFGFPRRRGETKSIFVE